jgi:hypothetical protein
MNGELVLSVVSSDARCLVGGSTDERELYLLLPARTVAELIELVGNAKRSARSMSWDSRSAAVLKLCEALDPLLDEYIDQNGPWQLSLTTDPDERAARVALNDSMAKLREIEARCRLSEE